jgi:hypothetical protein
VLALRVGVGVARGAAGDDLAVTADAIEAVDRREVVPAPAGDAVADAVHRLQLVGAARAANACGRGHGSGDEQKGERD